MTEHGRKVVEANVKRYEEKNPEKRKAWVKARDIPKKPCEICGTLEGIIKHHDDYTKPKTVRFFCGYHHYQFHKKVV